jgi:zinc/manganese transport system ATP-binding protein
MTSPILTFTKASLRFNERTLWRDLNVAVKPGEFIALLGPNGSGKTSFLKVVLGLNQLSGGNVKIHDTPPHRGNSKIGYIPQQKAFDSDLPLRGRDIVQLGLDGHRYGLFGRGKRTWSRVDEVIKEVGATRQAMRPIGSLSGGEQQRLRIAQALLSRPELLLCDEPLLSLDLKGQQIISSLINTYRQRYNMAVLFVTHDINPILDMVDRVLYVANGQWALGTPDEVLTTECLTQLYGTPVDVLKVRGRIVVVTGSDTSEFAGHHLHDNPASHGNNRGKKR